MLLSINSRRQNWKPTPECYPDMHCHLSPPLILISLPCWHSKCFPWIFSPLHPNWFCCRRSSNPGFWLVEIAVQAPSGKSLRDRPWAPSSPAKPRATGKRTNTIGHRAGGLRKGDGRWNGSMDHAGGVCHHCYRVINLNWKILLSFCE